MALSLPVFQNYDCHSCGFCCRNLVVNVTPAERARILEAGWSKRIPDQLLFIEYRFGGRRLIRLAHRDDGACVFLGSDGKCRIHAETGLAAKPLAGVGLISYAFYLWHWPLFAFLNVANATSIRHFALAILIAFALSVVSYIAVERPIRYRAPLKSRQVFAAFACSMILFLSIGLAGIATNGFESRFSNRARG
jgi:hypothetical protein